jgi:hypothetical protein
MWLHESKEESGAESGQRGAERLMVACDVYSVEAARLQWLIKQDSSYERLKFIESSLV